MQRISRAPELSATFSLDSCWITSAVLLCLLDHVDQAPALGLREGTGLDDPDHVALAGLISLVVRVQRARAADDLLVSRMTADDVDPHRDRFLPLVGDDDALADLGRIGIALRARRAGAGLALGLGGGARLTASGGGGAAIREALGGPLLRGELLACIVGAARFLQAPACLPRHVRIVP